MKFIKIHLLESHSELVSVGWSSECVRTPNFSVHIVAFRTNKKKVYRKNELSAPEIVRKEVAKIFLFIVCSVSIYTLSDYETSNA